MRTFMLIILLFIASSAYAQKDYLLIKRQNSRLEKKIHEGVRVKVICDSDKILKGKMIVNNNEYVVVDGDSCLVSEIQQIQ